MTLHTVHLPAGLASLFIALAMPADAAGLDAAALREKTGLQGGLVVVAGVKDAALLQSLGADGHWLVQAWVADDATVDTLRAQLTKAGVYGLVSVARYDPQRGLPYSDQFADAVILRPEALGAAAPALAECERVGDLNGP